MKSSPLRSEQSSISWQSTCEMYPIVRCVSFEFLWDTAKMLFERQLCKWKEHSLRWVMLHLTWKLQTVFGKGTWTTLTAFVKQGFFFGRCVGFLVWGRGWKSWGFLTFRNIKLLSQSGCCLTDFFSLPSLHPHPLIADQVRPVHVWAQKCCPNSKRLVQTASQLCRLRCHHYEPHFWNRR